AVPGRAGPVLQLRPGSVLLLGPDLPLLVLRTQLRDEPVRRQQPEAEPEQRLRGRLPGRAGGPPGRMASRLPEFIRVPGRQLRVQRDVRQPDGLQLLFPPGFPARLPGRLQQPLAVRPGRQREVPATDRPAVYALEPHHTAVTDARVPPR